MKPIHHTVDRATGPILLVGSILHGLLFAAFAMGLLLADVSAVRAAEDAPACQGRDLYAELKVKKPELAAKAMEAFEATPNRQGRFWRIDKDGVAPSWLFGTIHTTDPRTLALPDAVSAAFDQSDIFVMEAADVRSKLSATLAMARHPSLFVYTDGKSAFDEMDGEDRQAIEAALVRRGIDPSTAVKLKPWLIAGMLAAPPCELKRKAAGLDFLDNELANKADDAGKDVEGLETMVGQMEALSAMPMESHIEGLIDAADLDEYAADMTETLTARYLAGDIGLIMPALEAISEDLQGPLDSQQREAAEVFEERVVLARNHHMADASGQYLENGNAFIAIGALHLPGEEGVVELLRKAGWTLTAVPVGQPNDE